MPGKCSRLAESHAGTTRVSDVHGYLESRQGDTEALSRLLFGDLFIRLEDYALRFFVSDILRHLLIHNYEVQELWEHSSEEVMDFPTSHELDALTLSKILDVMSALDARKAFNTLGYSRAYRVADVNMSSMQYHSARSDTVMIVDDDLTLLVPNRGKNRTSLASYEIPITKGMYLENIQSPVKQTSYVRICWKDDQGYVIWRGKKEKVRDVRLQFTQQHDQDEFCKAFDGTFQRHAQRSWLPQSQEQAQTSQRLQEIVVNEVDISDTEYGQEPRTPIQPKCKASNLLKEAPVKIKNHVSKQISSDSVIEQLEIVPDVFARASHKNPPLERPPTNFSKKLRQEYRNQLTPALIASNSHDGHDGLDKDSSPLKNFGRSRGEEEVTTRPHDRNPNLALNVPLHQHDDDDYASFLVTASRANASPVSNSPAQLDSQRQESRQHSDSGTREEFGTHIQAIGIDRKSTQRTASNALPRRTTAADQVREAPKRRLRTMSSYSSNKTSKSSAQSPGSTIAPTEAKDSQKPRPSKTQVQAPTGRKKSGPQDVDWDEDLRTDGRSKKRQKIQLRPATKVQPGKPLRDVTNTPRSSAAPATGTGRNKAADSKKVIAAKRHILLRTSVTPVRKSQRTATDRTKSYAESSTSEVEETQEDSSEEGVLIDPGREKSHSLTEPENRKPTETKKPITNLLSDKALAKYSSQTNTPVVTSLLDSENRIVIEVESSDHESESEGSKLGEESVRFKSKQTQNGIAPSVGAETDNSVEVLDDSYPREEMENEVLSTDADQSFGTKLSNMIATTPVTLDASIFRAPGAPFGNQKQFVHNVNATRELNARNDKLSPPLPARPRAGPQVSGSSEHIDSASIPQQRTDRLERYQGALEGTVHPKSLGTPEERHRDLVDQVGSVNRSLPKAVEPPNRDHDPTKLDEERARDDVRSPWVHEAATNRGQELQNISDVFNTQHSHLRKPDNPSSQRSSPINSNNTGTTDISDFSGKPQQILTTSNKDFHGYLTSRTPNLASCEHKILGNAISSPHAPSTVTSNGTHIIHFSNTGPIYRTLSPNTKLAHKPEHSRTLLEDKPFRTSGFIKVSEKSQAQRLPTRTRLVDDDCPNSGLSEKSGSEDSCIAPAMTAGQNERQDMAFEENDACCILDTVAPEQVSEVSVAPSLASGAAAESGATNQRSNSDIQSHRFPSAVPSAPNHRAQKGLNTNLSDPDRIAQSVSHGKFRILPIDDFSTTRPTESHVELEAAKVERPSLTDQTQDLTHHSSKIQRSDQQHRTDTCARITDDQNSAPPITTKPVSDQDLVTSRSDTWTTRVQSPGLSILRTPQSSNTTAFGRALRTERPPLFMLSTVARSIFGNENSQKSLNNTVSSNEREKSKLTESHISTIQSRELLKGGGNSNGKAGAPNLPTATSARQSFRDTVQGPRLHRADSSVSVQDKMTAGKKDKGSEQFSTVRKIARIVRQHSSPHNVSSTLTAPLSTPRAFLEHLHAPTSPVVDKPPSHDVEQTRYSPPDHFTSARIVHTYQPRSMVHTNLPVPKQSSIRYQSQSSVSSESEECEPAGAQGFQSHSGSMSPANNFASTVSDGMLEVIGVSTEQPVL